MDNRCLSVQIGDIGEAHAIYEFTKLGIPVSKPVNNGMVYDLIIDVDNRLYKVQVKTTSSLIKSTYNMTFDLTKLDVRSNRNTHYSYSSEEVDFFYLYCIEEDVGMLLPVKDAPKKTVSFRQLKYAPANGQRKGIRFAEDYTVQQILDL